MIIESIFGTKLPGWLTVRSVSIVWIILLSQCIFIIISIFVCGTIMSLKNITRTARKSTFECKRRNLNLCSNTGTVIHARDTYFYDHTRCETRKGCDAKSFSWCGIQVHAAESGDRVLLFDIRGL